MASQQGRISARARASQPHYEVIKTPGKFGTYNPGARMVNTDSGISKEMEEQDEDASSEKNVNDEAADKDEEEEDDEENGEDDQGSSAATIREIAQIMLWSLK